MLLARMAEAVYWAGRYLERAEDTARIVQVHGETHIDLPVGEDVGWAPLVEIAGTMAAFHERNSQLGSGTTAAAFKRSVEARVVAFVLSDRDNPSSILASIAGARDNLRLARPVVPREVWELCNELWISLSPVAANVGARDQRVRWLQRVIDEIQRVNGVMQGTMRRDEALAFFRMGQQLERAEITCRVLAVRADSAVPDSGPEVYSEVHQMALLRSLASYQPFRRAMPARPDATSTLRFLLQDEAFPRAVSACLGELRDLVKALPHNEPILAACTDTAVLVADAPLARPTPTSLRAFLAELGPAMGNLHDHIEASFFSPVAPASVAPNTETTWAPRPLPHHRRFGSPAACGEAAKIDAVAEDRLYRVTHTTTYEYAALVEQSYNEAHLRPRQTDNQVCIEYSLEIDPEASTRFESVDPFGNSVATFVVQGGFDRMAVTSSSVVRVSPPPAPPAGPPWESVRTLLEIDRQSAARDARRCRAPSLLIPTSNALAEYAQGSFHPGRPLVEAVLDLTDRVYREFHYEPGFTSIATPLLEVFEQRRGVCQDFAHLMIGCIRSLGLAARYVSGYIETFPPPGQERLIGADASHAWASVYLPGWGWVDVDPTNDQFVAESYITTAWGRDYWDVSPLRGSVEGGGGSHRLEVAVDVGRAIAAEGDA
ncbi:MAG TPA: alpha-E domain-containing protein [Acidimicrobiales bacterium]|nr:alpha-E domain-containing protein [Acidimicrobiales bacterium]